MKKKKSSGGGANWMDTYGDMVTLLLCFFVLLYSMSTIDTDKWKALVQSFNPNAIPAATEIEGGNDGPSADSPGESGVFDTETIEDEQKSIDEMIDQLYIALQNYTEREGMQDTISVAKDGGKVYVTFKETAFFDGEKWELRTDAIPILEAVCGMLSEAAPAIDQVRIQGHTAQAGVNPNNPRTDRFLASNRATNVLVFIQTHSAVDPARLVSEGFGQWQPRDTNATSEGRANNRRVELIISGRDLETELMQQYDSETGSSIQMDTGEISTQPSAS